MAYYNVNKIEKLYDDFSSIMKRFQNKYLDDFNNSYIKNGNNDITNSISKDLSKHYNRINRIYRRINTFWTDFLNDVKNTDLCIAGAVKASAVKASEVSGLLSSLPKLKEYDADLGLRIKSVSARIGTAKFIEWSDENTTGENLLHIMKRCAATISAAQASLVEGIIKLGEDLLDLAALTHTTGASVATGMVDLFNFTVSKITGDDSRKTEYTKNMWERTRATVSKDYTKSLFDTLYEGIGSQIKENAYGFDMVRSVGTEIGEVAGVIALSVVTGGSAAVIYGGAKVAEHTEENWQDESASTAGGLIKGVLQGTADGAFFAIGAKGDSVMKSLAQSAVETGGKQFLKKGTILLGKTAFECGCSVAQDSSSILLNTIFSNDVIKTGDGETINFNNFKEKWDYYYEQAGGTQGLINSMATAGILSFVSDYADIRKIGGSEIKNTFDVKAGDSNNFNLNKIKNTALEEPKFTLDDFKYDESNGITSATEYLKSNLRKFSYTDTNLIDGVNDNIRKNGLLHFTSDDAADKILNSGYIKKTGVINSYGTPKTYFFNDIPSVGQFATNIDNVPIRTTAVKIVPNDDVILSKKLKIRSLDDGAISYDGKFSLSNAKDVSKEYFCIFKENNELVYKKVPKAFYDNYPNTLEGKALTEFLSNKKNIDAIKTSYLSDVSSKFNKNFSVTRDSIKNGRISSKTVSQDIDISTLKKEYNELINQSKEPWFVKTKEAVDNHYAWNLENVAEADKITKRMKEIENILSVKQTASSLNSNSINKNLVKLQSLPKTIAGIFTSVPAAISKMKNVDITLDSKIFKKIQTQGLYHFTDEISAKKILDSGYIQESNVLSSYGKKRTFLFAGVPTVEDTCLNNVFDYKKTAVKLHPSDAEITSLQYRKYSDSAVSSLGNYNISNSSPEIVYLVLKEKDGILKYTEVPKIEYDNFNPNFNDNVINRTIEDAKKNIYKTVVGISAEFDNVVKGTKQYANDIFIKLREITKPTENNLKKTILSSIDSNYNEIQTMRKVYIELNKHTNYDVNYVLGNQDTKNSILSEVTTFNNLTNGNVVCKGWSELYAEALIESGIDPKKVNVVKAKTKNHWWVEVDIGDKIIRADATEAFFGSTDLANCKFGESTKGFIILNKTDSGMLLTNEILKNNPNVLRNSNDYFRDVDKSINYVGDNGYFTENVTKLKNLFKNEPSLFDDIVKNTDVLKSKTINYMSVDVPKNMNGYDAFAYYRKLSITLFGENNNVAIPSLKKINIDGKDYSAVEIFMNDGKKEYFMTFDEINGKKIYSREEYLNGPINNYEEFR